MTLYLILGASLILNLFLAWYLAQVLRKLFFISEHISDIFLTTKAFQIFVKSMYSMDSYHGEPMIEELITRIKEVDEEIEEFREIFEYTLDTELEEELNAAQEEEN